MWPLGLFYRKALISWPNNFLRRSHFASSRSVVAISSLHSGWRVSTLLLLMESFLASASVWLSALNGRTFQNSSKRTFFPTRSLLSSSKHLSESSWVPWPVDTFPTRLETTHTYSTSLECFFWLLQLSLELVSSFLEQVGQSWEVQEFLKWASPDLLLN